MSLSYCRPTELIIFSTLAGSSSSITGRFSLDKASARILSVLFLCWILKLWSGLHLEFRFTSFELWFDSLWIRIDFLSNCLDWIASSWIDLILFGLDWFVCIDLIPQATSPKTDHEYFGCLVCSRCSFKLWLKLVHVRFLLLGFFARIKFPQAPSFLATSTF